VDDDGYHVIAEHYETDRLRKKHLQRLTITNEALAGLAKADETSAPVGDTESTVRQRVEAFWQAMQDEEYAKVYDLFDPFFRARNSLERYLRTTGRIAYKGFNVESVDVEGPRAQVKTKIQVQIKPFRASTGEKIERPEVETTIDETWLNIDGQWFREFYSESQDLKYTRY
jgi:hypothetical protein